jgi:hypothetical protein
MYDIIGDIHGHYKLLVRMLRKLGYENSPIGFKHPERKVIFTGDYINRGPEIRETVSLIRQMVESGNALAILGNHELNAIIYFTLDKESRFFRKYASRLRLPLLSTIEQYAADQEDFKENVKWFRHLPFFLDMGDFRVAHGGWNDSHINTVNQYMNGEKKIKRSFLKEFFTNPGLNRAVNELVKGIEFQLPKDLVIRDTKGISHRNFRVKWWEPAEGKTFNEASFSNRFILPAYTMPKEIIPEIPFYPDDLPPVFFGHYCLEKQELIIKKNLCCVDRCVVRSQTLTAYRWNGEKILSPINLVHV